VSHYGLAIYIKKYLKAKEELWKLKYFTMQNIIFKKSSKQIKNPSRYYNSITNLNFQHKPIAWFKGPTVCTFLTTHFDGWMRRRWIKI
jgi:hypothetical protein